MELTSTTLVRSLRPARRRGFPADLALGFYLYAPERFVYVWAGEPDRYKWRTHRFVAGDGRLVKIDLPPTARVFVWPAGYGPRPEDSIVDGATIWAQVPRMSMAALSSAELNRVYRLWQHCGHPPAA